MLYSEFGLHPLDIYVYYKRIHPVYPDPLTSIHFFLVPSRSGKTGVNCTLMSQIFARNFHGLHRFIFYGKYTGISFHGFHRIILYGKFVGINFHVFVNREQKRYFMLCFTRTMDYQNILVVHASTRTHTHTHKHTPTYTHTHTHTHICEIKRLVRTHRK